MKRRRRDETRWSDRTALVAASVALPVAIAAAAIALLLGDLDTVTGLAYITVPAVVAAVATAVAAHVLLIRRHRDRERTNNRRLSAAKRELHDEKQERAVLRELDAALDRAPTETDAIDATRDLFTKHLSMQPMELHLVDPIDPVLELVIATGDHPTKEGGRPSPWDSVAASTNTTLVYATTDRPDVCGHLLSRLHRPMSAIATPVNVMGQLLGVLYGLGPEGQEPGVGDVKFLEDVATLIGARLAILRASTSTAAPADHTDRLTGLPDRAEMQDRVLRLLRERQPFTVAVADIDDFGRLNEIEGRDAGDRALQLVARISRRAIRPGDLIGRIGGDEFLFILPRTRVDDATRAFERLREELVLAQTGTADRPFSMSIGVIGSSSGGTIEEILQRAAGALQHAKAQGGNRVVLAQTSRPATPGG